MPRLELRPSLRTSRWPCARAAEGDGQFGRGAASTARRPSGALGPRQRVLWFYTPMALRFAGHLDAATSCVYDCMDELSAFHGAPRRCSAARDGAVRRAPTLVFTGGRSLYEAKRDRHPNVHAFPSSVDAAALRRVRARAARRSGRPGVHSAPAARLLRRDRRAHGHRAASTRVAGSAPTGSSSWSGRSAKIDPAALPQRPNIHWLGHAALRRAAGAISRAGTSASCRSR